MKTRANQNLKLQDTYYKTLKAKASEKYFTKSVGVFGNSENYPNTVSLTTEDLVKHEVAVFVNHSTTPSQAYAILMTDLMPILNKWNKAGNTLLCDSKSVDTNEVGNLIRVPFAALSGYVL